MSRLLAAANGTEYFMASLVALPLIERAGRRKLMFLGSFGMMTSMAVLAGSTSTGRTLPNGAPELTTSMGVLGWCFQHLRLKRAKADYVLQPPFSSLSTTLPSPLGGSV